jgi:hypothetical protein
MQQEKQIQLRGTGNAIPARMTAPLSQLEISPRSAENQPRVTLVSLVAARAGREAVWVFIASIFVIVEALVFLTELPTTKVFHRREAAKAARPTP